MLSLSPLRHGNSRLYLRTGRLYIYAWCIVCDSINQPAGDLDLWPFYLYICSRVTRVMGFHLVNFGLPKAIPSCDACDRRTDRHRPSFYNAPHYRGQGIIKPTPRIFQLSRKTEKVFVKPRAFINCMYVLGCVETFEFLKHTIYA